MVHGHMIISCCQKPVWLQLGHSCTGWFWPEAQQAARDQLHQPPTPTRAFGSNPPCYGTGVHLRERGVVNGLQLSLGEFCKANGLWAVGQFAFRPDSEDTVTSSDSQPFFHVSLLTVQVQEWITTGAPRLFSDALPGVNLLWYLKICSCHRGWFRI